MFNSFVQFYELVQLKSEEPLQSCETDAEIMARAHMIDRTVKSCEKCGHIHGWLAWKPKTDDITLTRVLYEPGKVIYTCVTCGEHTLEKPQKFFGDFVVADEKALLEMLLEYHSNNLEVDEQSIEEGLNNR